MSKEHKLVKHITINSIKHLYKLKDQETNDVVILKSELIELTNFERGKKQDLTIRFLNL